MKIKAACYLPAILLFATALAQLYNSQILHLTPWKGGGFGMFSTIQLIKARFLKAYLIDENEKERPVSVPDRFSRQAVALRAMPDQEELNRLADRLIGPGLDWHVTQEIIPPTRAAETSETIRRMNPVDLCTLLTLLLLMLYGGIGWYLRIPLRVLCLSAIVIPTLRQNALFWFVTLIFLLLGNGRDWITIDNHKYLMTYWCLVMFLVFATSPENRLTVLSVNARLLIGLCFGFATFQKIISEDYLDGRFFLYELLFDDRFETFAWLVGGVDRGVLGELRILRTEMVTGYEGGIDLKAIELVGSRRLMMAVQFLTWWTILIEGLIAVAFLWWKPNLALHWCRHLLLILFILSTYSVALVRGFAWTVIIMGVAQLPPALQRFRIVYLLLCLVFLQICEAPYVRVFEKLFGFFG